MLVIAAYAHVGLPRFGSPEEALTTADRFGIQKQVLVLGPGVPDCRSLFRAVASHPERIRGIGIPFGNTETQRFELAELQLQAGVIGLRVESREILDNPDILRLLGENGR